MSDATHTLPSPCSLESRSSHEKNTLPATPWQPLSGWSPSRTPGQGRTLPPGRVGRRSAPQSRAPEASAHLLPEPVPRLPGVPCHFKVKSKPPLPGTLPDSPFLSFPALS